jgi:MFS transporter, AAHS family, 4-hydroxybenzoate transporter
MNAQPGGLPIDLGSSLDEGSWGSFQKLILVMVALGFAVDGFANQVLGLAIPALTSAWSLPRSAFAPATALGFIGMTIGAAAGGLIGDRFGRRIGLIGSMVLFGVASAATAACSGVVNLSLLRTLACLGVGGALPNCAALLAEFTPLRHRSMAIAIGMIGIPLGGVLAGAVGACLLPRFGWQSLFLVGGVVPVVMALVLIVALPESPRFLLRRPRRRVELLRLLSRLGYGLTADAVFVDEQPKRGRTPISALFGASSGRQTVALWAAFFFCTLSTTSIYSWLPSLLGRQGFGLSASSSSLSFFYFGSLGGALISGWILQRLGSRLAWIIFGGGGLLGTVALAVVPSAPADFTWLIALLTVVGFFIGGMNVTLVALAAYMYPSFVKATGVGTAQAVGRIGAIASSFSGVLTMESGGAAGFFLFIAAAMAVCLGALLTIQKHMPRVA